MSEYRGSLMDCISWLSKQKDGEFEIKPYSKRSLNQNRFYHMIKGIIAKALRVPPPYVHNLLLRRMEIFDTQPDGKVILELFTDDDRTDRWIEYHSELHLKPTMYRIKNDQGNFRFYQKLKGSSEYNPEEMSMLIDLALDEMESMGLMLPQDEATLKAYEEHKKHSTQQHNV